MAQTLPITEEEVKGLINQERQLNQLQSKLEDVNILSIGLAEIIQNQRNGIDNIEASVAHAGSDVIEANVHLQEAVEIKKKIRGRQCCCAITCLIVLLILIGIILLYFLTSIL